MSNMLSSVVSMNNVCMTFNECKGPIINVLSNFSLDVPDQQILGIVGPSGCGKTTILKIIGGLLTPQSGEVMVAQSTPIVARSKQAFSFMFQKPVLLPWLTIRQNVQLPAKLAFHQDMADANGLLQLVGLSGFENAFPRQLSGGMQARAELARSLFLKPELLLMDEPFGALDAMTRNIMQNEFLSILKTKRSSVIFVTHSIDEAVYLADRVIVLSNSPAQILLDLLIQLPRPRTWATKDDSTFLNYRAKIEEVVFGRNMPGNRGIESPQIKEEIYRAINLEKSEG